MAAFHSFVMFAEMRTGSNFLESNLNALAGVHCHGEAFNPHFIGQPGRDEILGITYAQRLQDPHSLLSAIKDDAGHLGGFRYFHDHDPRIFEAVMEDRGIAKIVLTRNPVESYVSWKIASATGQWKLTNAKHAKSDVVTFDGPEFEAHLTALQDFQLRLLRGLQTSGQTAFYIDYEDIADLAVMNGLAAFLGVPARLDALDKTLKKQNPEPLDTKVGNFPQMEAALARLDRFNLNRSPNFEPRRGPGVPGFLTAASSPLLYMPVKSGPEAAVTAWLAALDGAAPESGHSQKTLRQWRQAQPGHRSFTVIRHPLARAHSAFVDRIVQRGAGSFGDIRDTLVKHFGLTLPDGGQILSDEHHAQGFTAFLGFLKANLGGQTAIRVDAAWASQTAILQGMAGLALPDLILRETDLPTALPHLAALAGKAAPELPLPSDPHAAVLARIVTPQMQSLAREIYQRDMLHFGFGPWEG